MMFSIITIIQYAFIKLLQRKDITMPQTYSCVMSCKYKC